MTVKTKNEQSLQLDVKARLLTNGITLSILNRSYKIEYPKAIWSGLSNQVKKLLLENLSFGETHFLPLILNKKSVQYNFNYPLGEASLFKTQLYDMLDCEIDDQAPHLSYLKKFYNLDFHYQSLTSTLPLASAKPWVRGAKIKAIIPFSFGKESLASFAVCQELGIEPILVYCQEPVQPYEEKYKLRQLAAISREFKVQTHFIKHQPGLFRYGQAFHSQKKTEIGWGTQTNLLALLVLPFVFHYRASYIFFGNENLNNDVRWRHGWKAYISVDQHQQFTPLKDNLVRQLTAGHCQVKSLLEPLEEISVTYLLHHRYPRIGRYQFSCLAEKPLYGGSQWCHQCPKCFRSYIFMSCSNIDPATNGFRRNIIPQIDMTQYYPRRYKIMGYEPVEPIFALYHLYRKNLLGQHTAVFRRKILPKMKSQKWYRDFFFRLKPSPNQPPEYDAKLTRIFKAELAEFKKSVLNIND